ncbi:S-layer homology domain-containing protein [Desertibacillus haloalkaliphilus]|uniref:S-layer homology domain-containing protein n=1 Tax=Desertibacillus haloalkaliphilus TaxID=1328930 RepID=UPI001C25467C|nr:S-layer homology domain-containing protein [Desertibacillus haloalkaliphilus]MBU8905935.1 S-layer homology domain-containing protein [Desertibacillus haloalkaliphilus]
MTYKSKPYRLFLAATASATVVTTVATPVAPNSVVNADGSEVSFADVSGHAYYEEPIQALVDKGIIKGYADGTFKPDNRVTRAEVAQIIVDTLDIDTTNVTSPGFTDVDVDDWYYGSIAALVEKGIVNGYKDGSYNPNGSITRAEMAKVLVEAFSELELNMLELNYFLLIEQIEALERGFV